MAVNVREHLESYNLDHGSINCLWNYQGREASDQVTRRMRRANVAVMVSFDPYLEGSPAAQSYGSKIVSKNVSSTYLDLRTYKI